MEQKLLEELNKMAAFVKEDFENREAHRYEQRRYELARLFGAVELANRVTGLNYTVQGDGTVIEN